MATFDDNVASLDDLSRRIVGALDVLDRADWYAARLMLADLWQELEDVFATGEDPPHAHPVAGLSRESRVRLAEHAAHLAQALRARPQAESQEMARRLEEILAQ